MPFVGYTYTNMCIHNYHMITRLHCIHSGLTLSIRYTMRVTTVLFHGSLLWSILYIVMIPILTHVFTNTHIHTYLYKWNLISFIYNHGDISTSVLYFSMKLLLTNPVVLVATIVATLEVGTVSGLNMFMAKFLQFQFRLTPANASLILGRVLCVWRSWIIYAVN